MTPLDHPAIALALLLAVVTVGYVGTVVTWPFVNCRRCTGTGRTKSWIFPKSFRVCRHCGGTGRRLRTARVIWNFFRRLHGNAHSHSPTTSPSAAAAKAAARAAERTTPR